MSSSLESSVVRIIFSDSIFLIVDSIASIALVRAFSSFVSFCSYSSVCTFRIWISFWMGSLSSITSIIWSSRSICRSFRFSISASRACSSLIAMTSPLYSFCFCFSVLSSIVATSSSSLFWLRLFSWTSDCLAIRISSSASLLFWIVLISSLSGSSFIWCWAARIWVSLSWIWSSICRASGISVGIFKA